MAKKLTFDERNDRRMYACVGLGILNAVTLGGLAPIVVPVQAILCYKSINGTVEEESSKGTFEKGNIVFEKGQDYKEVKDA